MQIIKKIICILLLTSSLPSNNAQEIWDWNKCIQYAMENNIQIQLDQINLSLSELQIQQDRLSLTPFVQTDASYTYAIGRTVDMSKYQYVTKPVNSGNFQVSLNQPIFEGLKNIHSVKKSKLDLQAAQLDNEALRQNIQLQIMNAYLNILNAQEQEQQAIEQLQRSQLQYQSNKILVDNGALSERMLVDNEVQIASDEYNIAVTKQQTQLAYMALKTILHLDLSKEIKILQPNIDIESEIFEIEPAEKIYQSAMVSRPEIKSAETKLESSQIGIKISRSAYYPSISFFSGIGANLSDQFTQSTSNGLIETPIGYIKSTGESVFTQMPLSNSATMPFGKQIKNNMSYAFGINLSIPIYNRRAGYISSTRAKLALKQSDLQNKKTQYDLYNNIEEAHIKAVSSEQNFKAAHKNLKAAQQSLEYAKERLKNGAVGQLELNLAQNNLLIAQSRLTQAKFEYLFNVKVLDFYSGKKIDLN
ncbi:MAG: TolC family protein [Chitinophagales bacterium]|nr:TolC family protein [Chitinophagales bacterium]MCZ2394875.1 TolC family protein [Chitinophagales bacterium]